MDLRNYFNPERKQIFVFDDVYGKYMLEQQKKETWYTLSNELYTILHKKTVKIVLSCRTHIFKQVKKDDILCRNVCNMLSDEHLLTVDERILMVDKYLPADVSACLQLTDYFSKYDFSPLLCKLSSNISSEDINKLFSNPVDFIKLDLHYAGVE
ncbi:unnamed protein product [Mytilus edulis]|uniref:Novel STAND NTPase 3 domain-containing protein n=1 Tax=Mytilus edulis TaxID=6550 RepID=A0A8S3RTA8_MYTED|nr:unnamed protein product [Mytilus edulis]